MKFKDIPILSWDIYNPEKNINNISHIIQIPNRYMDIFLEENKKNEPLVLRISYKNQKICFGNIEISNDDVIVVPYWVFNKMALKPFDKVSIEPIRLPKITLIKLKAIDSNYVYWQKLKEQLEERFCLFYAINKGDYIQCFNSEFYIINIYNKNKELQSGSLFNTDVKIEFETPTDIENLENINNKLKKQDIKNNEIINAVFTGKNYKLGGNTISREEALKKLESNSHI